MRQHEVTVTETRLLTRNIVTARGRTSMRLEPELWDALREVCRREEISPGDVVKAAEKQFRRAGRTSAVRVHLLQYFRAAATEQGHTTAGHGNAELMAGQD
jgi:predicted DNA-binding ribbon-helix-helix protein